MKTLFVFAPGWNPCGPYLALPIIKSYLHNVYNIDVDIRDFNVDFFDYILSKKYLKKCINDFDFENASAKVRNTVQMFSYCVDMVENAKEQMRSYDYTIAETRKHVDAVISNAFYIINNSNPGLKISFNSIELKYNRNYSQSVFDACFDEQANPFIEFYKNNIIDFIYKENYECVGISLAGHTQLIPALTLCRLIKKSCPKVKHITLGGNYITRVAEKLCANPQLASLFDSLSLYDGEISCSELLYALEHDHLLSDVHNIMYRDGNAFKKTELKTNNIINFYTPDFDGFPVDKYFSPELILPIYTSRCCYNKCAFCTIPNATMGKYRVIPIKVVVENIKSLQSKYKTHFFSIVDETFDINRMIEFASELLKEKIDIYWYCETRITKDFSQDKCNLLYKSGCRLIQFGIESYNQRVLDKMNKNIDVTLIDKTIDECLSAGISVHMFFFTGFPTETYEEALRTYQFTEKKLSESEFKYGIISSRGYGTFGLEIGSTVWNENKDFGIVPLANSIYEDLKLDYDYVVSSGLTQQQSERLVSAQRLRDGKLTYSDMDFELPWMDLVPEAHMVINATLNRNHTKNKQCTLLLTIEYIKSHSQYKFYSIVKGVSLTYTTNKIIFYNSHLYRAFSIPRTMSVYVTKNQIDLTTCYDENYIYYIILLEHFEFIKSEFKDIPFIDFSQIENYNLKKSNELVAHFNSDLREWTLSNYITRSSITLNEFTYKLIDLFKVPIKIQDIYNILSKYDILYSKDKLYELIVQCIRHDIIYALL